MSSLFIACATIGGTMLVCQFLMTLLGMGHHHLDIGQADMTHDLAGPISADSHGAANDGEHGSTWLFSVLSFRTLVAALTFFGLGGLAAQASEIPTTAQVAIAIACGISALYATQWIMRQIYRLNEDGTIRITRAVGQQGTVYLSIPPAKSAAGKVQIRIQYRLMEYEAVTDSEQTLVTGTQIVVVGIEGRSILSVEPLTNRVAAELKS